MENLEFSFLCAAPSVQWDPVSPVRKCYRAWSKVVSASKLKARSRRKSHGVAKKNQVFFFDKCPVIFLFWATRKSNTNWSIVFDHMRLHTSAHMYKVSRIPLLSTYSLSLSFFWPHSAYLLMYTYSQYMCNLEDNGLTICLCIQ